MALKEKVEWYFKQRAEWERVSNRLGDSGPNCDQKLHSSWQCCDLHRALFAVEMAIGKLADDLNDAWNLGGVSNAYLWASYRGEDTSRFYHNPRAPQVGSPAWHEQLSKASGVPIPDGMRH